MEVSTAAGIPLLEGWTNGIDLPHTVTMAITYRSRINSLNELPDEKRPPRNLWDKPYRLGQFLDEIFNKNTSTRVKDSFIDIDMKDVEG